jgi:glycosyltransferase involved in cell wall biosynthesis
MNLPVIFTYHTQYERYAHYLPFNEMMVGEVAQQVGWKFANCCDAVIAPSSDIREMLLERGVTTEIRVIPTGVELARFKNVEKGFLRQRFGIGADETILLFVSRLAHEKNVGFLIESFAAMASKIPDSKLVLVGEGDAEEDLKKQAAEVGLNERIVFAGRLDGPDVVSAYVDADLFVFASTSETQGMVVLESMAAGCPVVAVDAPGVRDVVVEGETGFLLEEGDVEGFATRMVEILTDSDLHTKFREGALTKARTLSLARTSRRVESLYKHVLLHRRPRRDEFFLMLKEVFRYQWNKITEGIDEIIP